METSSNAVNISGITPTEKLYHEERKSKIYPLKDSTGDERYGGLIGMCKIDDRFYRKFFKDGSVYIYDIETEVETLDTTEAKISWW